MVLGKAILGIYFLHLSEFFNHSLLIHGHTVVILHFFVLSDEIAIIGLSLLVLVAVNFFLRSLRAFLWLMRALD